jgi:hypothetical protein
MTVTRRELEGHQFGDDLVQKRPHLLGPIQDRLAPANGQSLLCSTPHHL